MGKRIDQLKPDDTPIVPTTSGPKDNGDPRGTDWYQFMQDIDDLLATGQYTWAEETLHDIQLTVEKTQRVSEGQRKAVKNIEDGGRGARRRSEGFSRRWR